MGVRMAPVEGSGLWPAWTARVLSWRVWGTVSSPSSKKTPGSARALGHLIAARMFGSRRPHLPCRGERHLGMSVPGCRARRYGRVAPDVGLNIDPDRPRAQGGFASYPQSMIA